MTKNARREEVALVTGSRRGIGLGIAKALAREGFNVVINGVKSDEESRDAVDEIKALGCDCTYIQADVSQKTDREKLTAEIKERYKRLDILVNNAGVAPLKREDILVATEESFDRVLDINLKGPYFLTQLVANWMIEQKKEDPKRNPKIVNVTSINVFTASPSRGEYCISKAALSMMTQLYAIRLAEYGIGVFEVRPGIIETDMTSVVHERYDKLINEGLTPIPRWGTPDDIGKAVLAFALDLLPFTTGDAVHVDGGFHLKTL